MKMSAGSDIKTVVKMGKMMMVLNRRHKMTFRLVGVSRESDRTRIEEKRMMHVLTQIQGKSRYGLRVG